MDNRWFRFSIWGKNIAVQAPTERVAGIVAAMIAIAHMGRNETNIFQNSSVVTFIQACAFTDSANKSTIIDPPKEYQVVGGYNVVVGA